ncbi:hypothetical protein F4810DRAFT_660522 [Camillea tinctor]|nr:hypothetical protein F4810DRAFT_660522 [Camillea tinctor]
MCKNCQNTYAASLTPASMAITNPALVWSQVQEQKRITAASSPAAKASQCAGSSSSSAPTTTKASDAASILSKSTTVSYDKDAAPKPKKSMRERIKDAWGN